MCFQGYMIPGIGAVVFGALAYRCLAVKQRSNFFRCGIDTEISLISRRVFSAATSSAELVPVADAPFDAVPFCNDGWTSTRRRFWAGSGDPECPPIWSCTKLAISLKSLIREGLSRTTRHRLRD